MLIMFRVKNFLSFKNDAVLDMRKSSLRELPDHTFSANGVDLLKTLAIYGANASGKSNLICAFDTFSYMVKKQLFNNKANDDKTKVSEDKKQFYLNPFLLSKEKNFDTEFEVAFIYKGILFQYGFVVNEENELLYKKEWLEVNHERVFYRDQELQSSKKYEKFVQKHKKIRADRLFISLLDYYSEDEPMIKILNTFREFFFTQMRIHFELLVEFSSKRMPSFEGTHKEMLVDPEFRKLVSDYIKKIDVGIERFEETTIQTKNVETEETKEEKELRTIHKVFDAKHEYAGETAFTLSDESAGTRQFMSFLENILKILETGGVYIVDELSSRLHPLLTKFIVDIFQSSINQKNAQLIFTTHETSIMNRFQFRRDEIVIVDKNEFGESELISLAELNVRADATFSSDYFKGKYGGVPIIEEVLVGDKNDV